MTVCFICYCCTDTPGIPHGLIVNYGHGSEVTLSWLAPKFNGGSIITEYLVEKRDAESDKWIKVNTSRTLSLVINSLMIGKAYQLRVTAGNLYGFGSPSEPVSAMIDEEEFKRARAAEQESSARGKKIKVEDYDKFCE